MAMPAHTAQSWPARGEGGPSSHPTEVMLPAAIAHNHHFLMALPHLWLFIITIRVINLNRLQVCWIWGWHHQDILEWVGSSFPCIFFLLGILTAVTTPHNTVTMCANQVSSIDSGLSWTRCKMSCEKLWLHWPMQQKPSNIGRKWGAKPPPAEAMLADFLTQNHHFSNGPPSSLTLCDPLWGHQSNHTLGAPFWGPLLPRFFGVNARTFPLYFPSCRRPSSWVYATKNHSIRNNSLNFWTTTFVSCCHP